MKKGFTLIELLAVIIILGILATIAIVEVTRYIEHTHVQTAQTGALSVLKGAQGYYTDIMTENGNFEYTQLNILESKELLDLSGGLPDSGYVTIDSDSTATVYYVKYGYCTIVNSQDVDIYMTKDLWKCDLSASTPPVYFMENTMFDGVDDWYDTGYALFDELKDFTIITSFKYEGTTYDSKDPSTLFHCMKEAKPYPGIAFDYMYSKGRIALTTTVKGVTATDLLDNKQILAIKMDSQTNKIYYYIFNAKGKIVTTDVTSSATLSTFEQNLIIGAYQNASGKKGRYFKGTIYNFSLYMKALDDEIIEEKMNLIK